MKDNIKLNIDVEADVPIRQVACELARADSITQADFFVWFFNELYYRACNQNDAAFQRQLAFLEADLDIKTKRWLTLWTGNFKQ